MRTHRTFLAALPLALALACADETGPDIPALYLDPVTLPHGVMPGALVAPDSAGVTTVWLTLQNTNDTTVAFEYGSCAFAALLYPPGSGEAAWQSVPAQGRVCLDILYQVRIPAFATSAVRAGALVGANPVPAPPVGTFDAAAVYRDAGGYRLHAAGRVTCTSAGCGT